MLPFSCNSLVHGFRFIWLPIYLSLAIVSLFLVFVVVERAITIENVIRKEAKKFYQNKDEKIENNRFKAQL